MRPEADTSSEGPLWQGLLAHREAYTCYSAALASWAAFEYVSWERLVNSGLTLQLVEAGEGLFGFVHFPPALRAEVPLARTGADDPDEGAAGILEELDREGRVIVAGDGYLLPWHVAAGRRHVPHWFVVSGTAARPLVVDPFECRNDLGFQEATLYPIDPGALAGLARAHPADSDVVDLRESFALGDDARPVEARTIQWFVRGKSEGRPPLGTSGPAAIRALARHFRDNGEEADAYRQVDDIWSIARHRAFLFQMAGDEATRSEAIAAWVDEHVAPLAKRWSHMAPLLFQAVLAIGAGRQPTGSVAGTLDELAEREAAAAIACPAEAHQLLLR